MIYVLECDHAFQVESHDPHPLEPEEAIQAIAEQRRLFAAKISGLLDEHANITLIGEEINQDAETHARRIASERQIEYTNIDMSRDQRAQARIPEGYSISPEGEAAPYHRIRERYFHDQVIARCYPDADALVVCGRLHARPLVELLTAGGHEAELVELKPEDGFNWEWSIP